MKAERLLLKWRQYENPRNWPRSLLRCDIPDSHRAYIFIQSSPNRREKLANHIKYRQSGTIDMAY